MHHSQPPGCRSPLTGFKAHRYDFNMRISRKKTTVQKPKGKDNQLFGEFVVSKGLLTKQQLTQALNAQHDKGGYLGEVLQQMGILKEDQVTSALAEYLSMDYYDLWDTSQIDMKSARLLPENLAKRFCLIILRDEGTHVVVAMADPFNVIEIDTIKLKIGREVKVVISTPSSIRRAIEEIYHGSDVQEQNLRDLVQMQVEDELPEEDLTQQDSENEQVAATKAPLIRFVDLLLNHAVKSRASDIHIEPGEKNMMIRMRIDGVLREMVPPPKKMQAAVVTRVKILAGLDIAERRLPQDGRFKIKNSGNPIDVRVSIIPTIYGEKAVMRILDGAAANHNVDVLGMDPKRLDEFKQVLTQPHGIIVVTGPTGSGKSTTLYSVLNYLKDPTKNITTVEDPVEYSLEGINQIQVKQDIDLDFAVCLRAILRQDPDIILIGEIRDKETVDIAIKASLTGHLVLSTFHTNDAPSAISRFLYMDIEPFLLASTLNMVLAQRLVRRICEHCKEPTKIEPRQAKLLGISDAKEIEIHHGKGCKVCGGSGYMGRLPVFEFLMIDSQIREMILKGASEIDIRKKAREKGYGGLMEDGVEKIKQGLTTPEEILRVAFVEQEDA